MNSLPASIESALREAGFTGTEILVLKKFLEEDGITVRQLAAKTGKSTGSIDQAIKKLLQKNILSKDWINDGYKYTLCSLDAIAEWLASDLRRKHEVMKRRHQNFESFLSTLKLEKKRPEIQYFYGLDGLAQAYRRLLEEKKEMLHFLPIFCSAEDDPLRDFRVEFFRERRRLGVFSRVISHDTPLGRRYRSRDPFEYRQTLLVPEEQLPFSFEKVVVGDFVACLNHGEKQACVMRYPELAAMERGLFEAFWKKGGSPISIGSDAKIDPISSQQAQAIPIPLSTRSLSQIRDFFLSKRSLITFLVFAFVAAGLTSGVYWNNARLNTKRIQERALAIAATAVKQIDAEKVDQIHTKEDMNKKEFSELHSILSEIVLRNPGVADAYIQRSIPETDSWEFVVDADPKDPALPGEIFSDNGTTPSDLNRDALAKPMFFDPFIDRWGTWITANAPIVGRNGVATSILGIDIAANDVHTLTTQSFSFVLYFIGLFALFVLIRLSAFNRSLMTEIIQILQMRKVRNALPISLLVAVLLTYGTYRFVRHLEFEKLKEQLKAVAITAAQQIDAKDLEELRVQEDWKKPQWSKVVNQLKHVREKNEDLLFAYIFRKQPGNPNALEFVADSHSINPFANSDIDEANNVDVDNDGKIENNGSDLLQWPGQPYPAPNDEIFEALSKPFISEAFYEDQWGKMISGYAPIYDFYGKNVAVLAVDISEKNYKKKCQSLQI